MLSLFFFFNDTATTEIYTLSLHDALPISACVRTRCVTRGLRERRLVARGYSSRSAFVFGENSVWNSSTDRKSTRLNSSHSQISYAVFCLKKKKHNKHMQFAVMRRLSS